jgi:hypothetical protein
MAGISAGILIVGLEEEIDGLELGVTFEISVSRLQRDPFYFPSQDSQVTGPIQWNRP